MTVLFNIFMRQTLTDDFWELHKNMNCAFPLIRVKVRHLKKYICLILKMSNCGAVAVLLTQMYHKIKNSL